MRQAYLALGAFWLLACSSHALPDAGPELNACGGTTPLVDLPGRACGDCRVWQCAGQDDLVCGDPIPRNACGECAPTPMEQCDGRDDDCDGSVDEGCAHVIAGIAGMDVTRVRIAGARIALTLASPWGTPSAGDVAIVTLPDLTTLDIITPTGSSDPSAESDGDIAGALVVWSGPMLGGLDLTSSQSFVEPLPNRSGVRTPALDRGGARMAAVFDRYRVSRWDLDGAMLIDDITDERYDSYGAPTLSGSWLVVARTPDGALLAHDTSNGQERALSSTGVASSPAFDNDGTTRLVFVRSTPTDGGMSSDVYLYDLATGEERRLSSSGRASEPRLSGSLACWTDQSDDATVAGIVVSDLSSGRQQTIAPSGLGCDISGRSLVFLRLLYTIETERAFYRELLAEEP